MTGLNVEESSGCSQDLSVTTQTPQEQNQSQLSGFETESGTSIQTQPHSSQKVNVEKTIHSKPTLLCNSSKSDSQIPKGIEIIEIPLETPTESKARLQMELLRYQIEYTRRDIYHRELAILEKERSLFLSSEERLRLVENCEVSFDERKTI